MCEDKLGIEFRSTKHLTGWIEEAGRKLTRVTLPNGRRELATGTLRSVIRQLGADTDLFDGLMACPKERDDLIARLQGNQS
jgi:hypothetical protein